MSHLTVAEAVVLGSLIVMAALSSGVLASMLRWRLRLVRACLQVENLQADLRGIAEDLDRAAGYAIAVGGEAARIELDRMVDAANAKGHDTLDRIARFPRGI